MLWVSREPGTDLIRLQVPSGPVTVIVDEHEAAMGQLHSQLGELLEQQAAAGPPAAAADEVVP